MLPRFGQPHSVELDAKHHDDHVSTDPIVNIAGEGERMLCP